MASIDEVGRGDYVKTLRGKWKEIKRVTIEERSRGGSIKSWSLTTKDGEEVDMRCARAYRKKEEMQK